MHFKQNNKESKTYVQGLRAFGNTLPRGLKGILKKNGYNYSEIISKWNIMVGEKISSCSYPKSIKMSEGNSNGTLVLAIKRGHEIDVEYVEKEIINKINSYFGFQLIGTIKLETFSPKNKNNKNKNFLINPSKESKKKIDGIQNENIRNSLSQLFKIIKND